MKRLQADPLRRTRAIRSGGHERVEDAMRNGVSMNTRIGLAALGAGLALLAAPAAAADPEAAPADPAPPLAMVTAPELPADGAAPAAALAAPAGVPHLPSPENLPPGTTQAPSEGRTLGYIRDLWHAVRTQDVTMSDAILLFAQRPMDANAPLGEMSPHNDPVIAVAPADAVPAAPAAPVEAPVTAEAPPLP